jgi:hypothetical protein
VSAANAEASIDQWTNVLDFARTADREEGTNGYRRRVWLDVKGTPVLEAYIIRGMGHGTPILTGSSPDACGTPAPFILSAEISSSVRIAEFFGLATPAAAHEASATVRPSPDAAARSFPWLRSPELTSKPLAFQKSSRASRVGRVITDALRAAGLMK